MTVAVIGGKLQGVEAVYLSGKAGYRTVLVDKNPMNPARHMCDTYIAGDVCKDRDWLDAIADVDLLLPTLEAEPALSSIRRSAESRGIPVAFDFASYELTSSKLMSNRLFNSLNLPYPRPWPHSRFPVIVKPDRSSGSRGIRVVEDAQSLEQTICSEKMAEQYVVQEFVKGNCYSLEVIGAPDRYRTFQVTDLHFDESLDCKRVSAPTDLEEPLVAELRRMTVSIAEALKLRGIMDVEVIRDAGVLKLLEIDARLPSQTPMAVFWSSGINLVEQLVSLRESSDRASNAGSPGCGKCEAVLLEHVRVHGNRMEVLGEHVMGGGGPLVVQPGFFGAKEAITNYPGVESRWAATIINTGPSLSDAWSCRNTVIERIMRDHGIEQFTDGEYGR
jgi:pyrrolysine biosynthesis protein PylC